MKKTTLLLTSLFASMYAFAQLNVRNNAYVFVDDQIVFVTDNVNIQESTANFYLRNEAQLIQGASQSTPNSGVGRLSVFQEGAATQFTHNIWCAPVGTYNTGNAAYNANGNNPFVPFDNIMEEATDPNPALAPITSIQAEFINGYESYGNSTLQTSTGSGDNLQIARYWFWKFGPSFGGTTAYADWAYVGDTGNVEPGYGFTMKGTDEANQRYDFRGRPNSGNIVTDVVTAGATPSYTMIGNPYPSALDTAAFIHDAANTSTIDTGTLYFWDQQDTGSHVLTDYVAGYATFTIDVTGTIPSYTVATMETYNDDGTVATTGGPSGSGKTVSRYLPIGQGFMIQAGANGTVTARNSHRAYIKESGTGSAFFRTNNSDTKKGNTINSNGLRTEAATGFVYDENGFFQMPDGYKRFRINVDFNDTYTRQLMHNFVDTATDGEDYGLETKFPLELASDIWWNAYDKKLNCNADKFDVELRIPLQMQLNAEQPVRFRLLDVQHFDSNQPIFVHDKKLDLYYDLTKQNFETTLPAGNYDNRFEVTFKDNSKEIELVEDELGLFNIVQNNNTQILSLINPRQAEVAEVNLYDMLGKKVFSSLDVNTNERFDINTRSLSEAVYVVKVDFTNGTSKSKKIVVGNK